jgi:hypothetical protein
VLDDLVMDKWPMWVRFASPLSLGLHASHPWSIKVVGGVVVALSPRGACASKRLSSGSGLN